MTGVPNFCVVVGANGTGKSTLFDVFGFLKDCLTYNVSLAIQSRGGFKEVVSRGADTESIFIELQFRLHITGKERLVTYQLEIANRNGKLTIEREVLRYKRGRYGSPYHFLDFSNGKGYAVTNEEDFDKTDDELDREEHSAQAMLEGILPQLMPNEVVPRFLVFEGKQDLDKRLEKRVRGWRTPETYFVVIRDKDGGDCQIIKQQLSTKLTNVAADSLPPTQHSVEQSPGKNAS